MNIKELNVNFQYLHKIFLTVSIICFGTFSLFAQNVTVTGTVTDASGPVPSVSVTVKGTTTGTLSNDEGKYTITVPNAASSVLVFSFLGYATQEIAVGNKTAIDVVLVETVESFEDVVVVGYGTQKKATLTGSVASVSGTELAKTKSGNIQNALIGRVTGVKVNQRTSQPGTFNTDFNIRGMGTPLVVIDGVPRENMSRLDESEIESISVLKDASAAIYGSRAANGVVLITTKKGRVDKKFSLEYNGYVGVQNMMLNVDLMDAVQYMRMYNEKAANLGQTLPYPESEITAYENGTKKSTDWLKETVKENPVQHQHSFSASGSTKKVDYFVNFGYFNQDGWFKSDNLFYKRFNLRSNVTAHLTDNLKADVFINLISDIRHTQAESTWRVINRGVYLTPPIYPVYYNDDPNYILAPPVGNNPVALSRPASGYNYNKERAIQTNLALEYTVPWVKGLSVKGMYSYDYTEDEWKIFRKGYNQYRPNGTIDYASYNPLARLWWGGENTLLQLSAVYTNTFNDLHNVSATLVYEESDREADNFWAQRNVILGTVDQIFAGDPSGMQGSQETGKINLREDDANANKDGLYHYANKGFIGSFSYAYASKYLLDFRFRYDGSSRFAPGHQWGFFPSVSGGWRLSEEAFIKELEFVNNLKIRASWGQMGNEGSSSYQFVTGYNYGNQGGYIFGNGLTLAAASRGLPNPNITWYTSTVTDIGIDAEFWNGLVGIVADVFRRNQVGLLAKRDVKLPGVVGMDMPDENLNSDMTHGFEFALTHRNSIKDFKYNFSGGIFMNRTKRIHVEESAALDSYDLWRNKRSDRWASVSDDVSWGLDYKGQYQSFDQIFNSGVVHDGKGNAYMLPGDLIYEDWNGDGIIDDADRHPVGINTKDDNGVKPLLNYHFSIGAEWKGFDFNILFQGAGMAWRSFFINSDNRHKQYMGTGYNDQNGFTEFYDRWHRADPNNPSKWQDWVSGKYPSVYQGIAERDTYMSRYSTFWLWNTAYLRVKSIELGYTVPNNLVRKIGFESVRVYFNTYNTFTFTGMPIGDPEVKDGNEYPLNRTFSVGLNVKF